MTEVKPEISEIKVVEYNGCLIMKYPDGSVVVRPSKTTSDQGASVELNYSVEPAAHVLLAAAEHIRKVVGSLDGAILPKHALTLGDLGHNPPEVTNGRKDHMVSLPSGASIGTLGKVIRLGLVRYEDGTPYFDFGALSAQREPNSRTEAHGDRELPEGKRWVVEGALGAEAVQRLNLIPVKTHVNENIRRKAAIRAYGGKH